jgi:phosphatidylinositol alpha-1,6-mannosyltransferase
MIVGLFTDLLSAGGVQCAGRQTAAVLASVARQHSLPYEFLSLNDPAGEHDLRLAGEHFSFRGFGRTKASFVLTALRLAAGKPTAVIAAHPHLAPPAMAMKALAPRTRVLVMTHGIELWKPLSPLRRQALRRADRVIAPSADTARKLVGVQGVAEEKIARLPWCVDPEFLELARNPQSLPRPAAFPHGRILLTVGRWAASERYKGTDNLIRAMPQLTNEIKNLRLVAVGDGDDRPRLEALARDTGINGSVHFLQGLSRSEIVACYANCDVFALPSAGEGFGFVFLEAMALGKPVVGGAHGGTPDLIQHGKTGFLVDHGDQETLVNVLRILLTDEHLRSQTAIRAHETVQTNYLFETFRSRLTELLESVCAF